jgi:hypothetical protein
MILFKEKTYIDYIIKNTMNTEQKIETENENTANEPQNAKENEPIQENKKKKFVFKEYYATNPEFRQRHLEKMKEKARCDCGRFINKYSLVQHKRTKGHATQLDHLLKHTEAPQ